METESGSSKEEFSERTHYLNGFEHIGREVSMKKQGSEQVSRPSSLNARIVKMSRLTAELRDALLENLMKHVESTEDSHENENYSIHQCNTEEKRIEENFRRLGLDDKSIQQTKEAVSAQVFASRRKTIDACLESLRSNVATNQYQACLQLIHLFTPFYRRPSYDSADYFAFSGGVKLLVDLVASSWESGSESDDSLAETALITCMEFSSSEERTSAVAKEGIMQLLVKILKDCPSQLLKSKATGVLCSLLDVREAQFEAVKAGILQPIIDVALSLENNVADVESAVSCLHCCASNPALIEDLLAAQVVDKLGELSLTIEMRHHAELANPDPPIIGLLPRIIVFICHATNGLLLNQLFHASWRQLVMKGTEDMVTRAKQLDCTAPVWARAMELADCWLVTETPESVWEAEFNRYVWPTLRPFTSLLRSHHPVSRRLGAFAVAKFTLGAENCDTLRREEGPGVDVIQLSAWSWGGEKEAGKRKLAKKALAQMFTSTVTTVDPPRLVEICLQYVSVHCSDKYSSDLLAHLPKQLCCRIVPFL